MTPEEIRDELNLLLAVVNEVDTNKKLGDERELILLHTFLMKQIVSSLDDIYALLDSKLP